MTSADFLNKFADEIHSMFNKMALQLNFDKTFKAQVVSKVSQNKCKVKYKGKEYTAYCRETLSIGQVVWVCAPQNNWSDLFVIY